MRFLPHFAVSEILENPVDCHATPATLMMVFCGAFMHHSGAAGFDRPHSQGVA
jgi:hypothetical protein